MIDQNKMILDSKKDIRTYSIVGEMKCYWNFAIT